ncbi:SHOCT domain-containing protein [Amycolatopsis sp. K13G38]|uniref:SHOCT domain-containing protein n=1 Tax=Amycolatopsis acididurans TaxID=2724524 RepID=A0ABX1IXV6_9PSEU|nr:SHOCT domain-containing protein [Amycolatopsis acididurans]
MSGLLRGIARTAIVAGTAKGVSNRVSRRQGGRWAAQEEAATPAPAPAPAPAPGPSRSAALTQLKELGELRRQGVLTEEEFQAEKQKILAT